MLRIWLLVFLAVACVVTFESFRRERQLARQRSIEQLGGFIDHGGRVIILGGPEINDAAIEQLRQFPQVEYLALTQSAITAQGLVTLGELKSLHGLDLLRTPVTPACANRLVPLSQLKALKMGHTSANDECLIDIARLAALEELDVSHCPISSGGVSYLLALNHLRVLILSATNVDDDCVVHLKQMPSLRRLDVDHTRVSHAAVRELRGALPGCRVGY